MGKMNADKQVTTMIILLVKGIKGKDY